MLPDELIAEGIHLRPFRFSDVSAFRSVINDPEMGLYLEGEQRELTEDDVSEIIARHLLSDKSERQVWAVTIDDEVVGAVSIKFSKTNRVSEIGYSVKKDCWGKGIARRAASAVVAAAFEAHPDLQRVQANIHPENKGSIKVAASLGMTLEGVLRSYAFVRGEVADEAIYAVTRSAWNEQAG